MQVPDPRPPGAPRSARSAKNTSLRALRITLPLLITLAATAACCASASAAEYVFWHPPIRLESARNGGLSGVACTATKLCVAVDTSGYAMTSINPTGSTKVWSRPFPIDAGNALTGISCPTATLCVAVDAAGEVVTSTNPTGGSSAWSKPVRIDSTTATGGGYAGLAGISCPTTALCVAVDSGTPGNVVSTIDPTGGAGAWTLVKNVGAVLTSVSCATGSFCVVAGDKDYYSLNPSSAVSTWRATGVQTGGGTFSAIACPALSLCLDAGYGNVSTGLITFTSKPLGPASGWTTTTIQPDPPNAGAGVFDGIGCLSTVYCVALDSADNVFVSSSPATGLWGLQTGIEPLSTTVSTNSSIGCGPTVCVVVDSNGYAITGGLRT